VSRYAAIGKESFRLESLLLILWLSGASAENVGTVSSPGNVLTVTVTVNDEGRPGYAITRGGKQIVTESRLGFLLTDKPKLERNFRGEGVQTRSFDETWEQPWGERRYVRNRYNEMSVRLTEKIPPARSLVVVFRVFDDGVGFRY
jgi:alpha-glucosidase